MLREISVSEMIQGSIPAARSGWTLDHDGPTLRCYNQVQLMMGVESCKVNDKHSRLCLLILVDRDAVATHAGSGATQS